MKLKDLTKEQAIEIANLINPYPTDLDKGIEQNYEFKYQPFSPRSIENSEGNDELVYVYWKTNTFADTIDKVRLTIYKNLDCHWSYLINNGEHSLPTNNQHKIQLKFIEWNIQPEY
jgi:hypothetical protein